MLVFSILGALEVRSPVGEAEISGELQRTLVQTLLVSGEQPVSGAALIEEMWGQSAPALEANALQAHISRLRRLLKRLEPERPSSRVTIHPSGYRLSVGEGELDAEVFLSGVRRAEALASSEPGESAVLLRSVLALWRAPVFGGFPGGPVCRTASARYEEHRMRAMELLFDAELALGRHAAILAELHAAHLGAPLRERFCEQLMVALYRAGRQVEALNTYRSLWQRLSEELGVHPSPTLQRVERAILVHDPSLAAFTYSSGSQ